MTTFITGATTDLGRVLVREYARQGEAMRLLIRPDSNRAGLELPGVEFVRGDITDLVALRKGITGCDQVCHLAFATQHAGDAEMNRVNREGTRSVLQAALDMRAESVVLVSDLALFGPTAADEEADETRLEQMRPPSNPYLQSRLAAEEIALEFAARDLAVKIVYPGMGYGCVRPPGHGGLAEHTLLHLAQGKSAVTPGSGRNLLPLTYFKDAAQAIILAQELGRVGQRYLLIGELLTWSQLWEDVADVLGQEAIQPRRLPRWLARLSGAMPADVLAWATRHWNYRNDKARRDLGWRPHTFHESMAETWDEYQALGWGAQTNRPVRAMRRA